MKQICDAGGAAVRVNRGTCRDRIAGRAHTAAGGSGQSHSARSPLSDGDVIVFVAFIVIVGMVFGFDMARTWWATTRWRREARRRRREIR
jgi:hypothetical protein